MTGISSPTVASSADTCGNMSKSSEELNLRSNSDNYARLRALYPFVDVNDLPLSWSPKDKANYISLAENNLKAHYKGGGKGHKDAAAVRANNFIPQSCLLYYFEIKIISKGRDGYMGIGLAAQGVNMQRLPGWDKQSYGYHGDDGHSFCSSGTGQPYGPTFTTNDIIGCAYNLVENNCFYTKNGLNVGIAFTDLPNVPLYPTVGLQTPGEEVEANFGLEPFCYNIEEEMKALRKRITGSILHFPVKYNEWQTTINKCIQTWLIHNGYCSTAEVFSNATKQEFKENVHYMKQRLRIQKLVLSGRIGDAIEYTNRLYPDVLKNDPNLLFALKCRQFVEMIRSLEPDRGADRFRNYDRMASNNSNIAVTNGISSSDFNGNAANDKMEIDDDMYEKDFVCEEEMTSDDSVTKLSRVLSFGKELNALSQQLKRQYGTNEKNKKLLQDAFSLLAYSDPVNSPVGWQLDPNERETVCQQLNNAIVMSEMNSVGCCSRPPLEIIIKHTKALLRLNGQCGAWLTENL
ncbi:ran-binding protein 9-like protein [Dinothrombium tinctorium]|uniref:Ran-binding protein 9-like protein n=1 Tax=Dinothrombium tinctorium TaxID=1965070 RepID=A0A443RDY9_9ACAR|nr:ran-binding protein 9-like protein [Dinothrombium tinctorium]